MTVPDQSHINRIRDALWQRPESSATLMVGAGFSRNAKKARPNARRFPLWRDFISLLCSRLYPPDGSNKQKQALLEASGTSGFLRLAQEYQAAFGRGPLHDLIREIVPDEDYVPGDLHIRLMRLPWRDIFTTNWDTLLERTRRLIADPSYGVIRTQQEIPLVPRPRIVKLHGSFPAHFPFIFTEEDYRRYQTDFAPFVNSVQQAMMETVFCLIGFSGDDPNFLHWSGWVRDNLGESMPKIYLAGWLDLSTHRRRMLEERNIVPIDLARHPQADRWPEHLRHRYAIDWILHTLERGRPYNVIKWPKPPDWSRSSVPVDLEPVEEVTVDAPVKEPKPPIGSADPENRLELIRNLVSIWKHNRMVYPGWLLIPPSKHYLIWRDMIAWEREILITLPELMPIEKLFAIREFVWRKENLLEPLSPKIEEATQNILSEIDCTTRKIGGVEERSAPWVEIREACRDLALALLTTARQRFDRTVFEGRLNYLSPFLNDNTDVVQRIHHEKCLWALYDLDFEGIDSLLREWRPDECDPIWMTRKAAILIEIDRDDEAIRLINNSLSKLREVSRTDSDLSIPSREGWTLYLASAFEYGLSSSTKMKIKNPPTTKRRDELSATLCDAHTLKRDLLRGVKGYPEKKKGPLFDLGDRRGKTISISNVEFERLTNAYRAVRLGEVAGLPLSAASVALTSDLLRLSVDRIVATNYMIAARLILRVATSEDDAAFNRIWSRSRVASMAMEEVGTLVELVSKIISFSIPKVERPGSGSYFWVTKLRVAMEAMSRLVLRGPVEETKEVLKQGLNYYRIRAISGHTWLNKPLYNLLSRSWESIPQAQQPTLVLDLLSMPIAELDEFEDFSPKCKDPGGLIYFDIETPGQGRNSNTEERWARIIQLIIRGLRKGGEARERAALRLFPLVKWGIINETENELIADAIWFYNQSTIDELPGGISLYDWTFMLLPEPKPGLAEQLFREKWLGAKQPKEIGLDEFLWQVGNALSKLHANKISLELKKDEINNLSSVIESWIKASVQSDDIFLGNYGPNEAIVGLQSILLKIDLSLPVAEELFTKIETLNQTNTPGFKLYPNLLKYFPDRLESIVTSMRMGLSSDNSAVAENALSGLYHWLKTSSDDESAIPPSDSLIQEIGIMIASRRKGVLPLALQVAKWIFLSGPVEYRDSISQSVLNGLGFLIEELRYDRDHGEGGDVEIPLLRWGCAHLALAMSASGYQDNSTVKAWINTARTDPLPEVRHAEPPTSVRDIGKMPVTSDDGQ